MFPRFTEQSRLAILHAQLEAEARHSLDVDTEHLLLGLLCEPTTAGATILREQGVTPEAVRALMPPEMGPRDVPAGEARLTGASKRALELCADEARMLGDGFIGTAHLAIGLARVQRGGGAPILQRFQADAPVLRARLDGLPDAAKQEALPRPSRPRASGGEGVAQALLARLRFWRRGSE